MAWCYGSDEAGGGASLRRDGPVSVIATARWTTRALGGHHKSGH